MKRPPIPLTDPRFVYVPSVATDVRKTFAKAREQMAKTQPTKEIA